MNNEDKDNVTYPIDTKIVKTLLPFDTKMKRLHIVNLDGKKLVVASTEAMLSYVTIRNNDIELDEGTYNVKKNGNDYVLIPVKDWNSFKINYVSIERVLKQQSENKVKKVYSIYISKKEQHKYISYLVKNLPVLIDYTLLKKLPTGEKCNVYFYGILFPLVFVYDYQVILLMGLNESNIAHRMEEV